MQIDEILGNRSPLKPSHDAYSAQGTKQIQTSSIPPDRSPQSSSRGRGRGRPPNAPGEKPEKLSGSQRRKLKYRKAITAFDATGENDPAAELFVLDIDDDLYSNRCKYGFLARVKAANEAIVDPGTRATRQGLRMGQQRDYRGTTQGRQGLGRD